MTPQMSASDVVQEDSLLAHRRSLQAETRSRQVALLAYRYNAVAPLSLEQTIVEGAALVARTLRTEHSAVALQGAKGLVVCAGTGWRGEVEGRVLLAGPGTLYGYVIELSSPVVVEDLALHTQFDVDPLFAEHGTVSALVAPIARHYGPCGIVGAYSSERRLFSPMDMAFVQGIANVIRAADYRERWRHGWPLDQRRPTPTER